MVIWGCLSNPSSYLWKVEQRQSNRAAWKLCGQALHRTIFSHSLYINGAGACISQARWEKHSLSWKGTHPGEERMVCWEPLYPRNNPTHRRNEAEAPSKHPPEQCKQTKWLLRGILKRDGYTMSQSSLLFNTGYRENTSTTYLLYFPMILWTPSSGSHERGALDNHGFPAP